MRKFEIDTVALCGVRTVYLCTATGGFDVERGWGVVWLDDYARGRVKLFNVKESVLRPAIWTFTGYVAAP